MVSGGSARPGSTRKTCGNGIAKSSPISEPAHRACCSSVASSCCSGSFCFLLGRGTRASGYGYSTPGDCLSTRGREDGGVSGRKTTWAAGAIRGQRRGRRMLVPYVIEYRLGDPRHVL